MSEDERKRQWEGMLVRLPTSFRQLCEMVRTGEMDDAVLGRIVSALILRDDTKLAGTEKALVMVQRAEMERMADALDHQRELAEERKRKWKERRQAEAERSGTLGNALERSGTETERETVRNEPLERSGTLGNAQDKGKGKGKDKGKDNINRSVPFARARERVQPEPKPPQPATERNGNGTVDLMNGTDGPLSDGFAHAKKLAAEFVAAARKDPCAFFSPLFDAVTVVLAVTGDYKSAKRWKQLIASKGESAVREETFTFWREISSGEDVSNRGASLNARLARLPDAEVRK